MTVMLNTRDFQQLSSFIYSQLGIKMPESKVTMLSGRLTKRLRALGIGSFSQYCDFLFSSKGQQEEMVHLISAVTTNKTDFFREPSHFDYLVKKVLPSLQQLRSYDSRSPLRIWSAGCSTGEEPYTLAMVLAEERELRSGPRHEILATDISVRVLDIARRAVYPMERVGPISKLMKKKYLLRGRDQRNPEARIVPELRKAVRFGRLNFMDEEFGLPDPVDVIFCRNVIIYFDKETQEQLMQKFSRYLLPGGYLFLGHSESLHGYDTPFEQVAPTIYRLAQ